MSIEERADWKVALANTSKNPEHVDRTSRLQGSTYEFQAAVGTIEQLPNGERWVVRFEDGALRRIHSLEPADSNREWHRESADGWLVRKVLASADGQVSVAAERLGIDPEELHHFLATHKIAS